MKLLLTLEELAQFALSIILFSQLNLEWWWFPTLLFLPDLSMAGYLINPKIGALAYNLFHHKLLTMAIYGLGFALGEAQLMLTGIILFGHSAMDRVFGYGLKYPDHFKHTHLGWIGKPV